MLLHLDANASLLLAAAGLLLICAEFCLPGWVIPGVLGGVFLLCGVHRLSQLDASAGAAAALILAMTGAGAAGYGFLPGWAGMLLLIGVPWLCRMLLPGIIHWPAAALAAVPSVTAFVLLRVAASAGRNKTLLQ